MLVGVVWRTLHGHLVQDFPQCIHVPSISGRREQHMRIRRSLGGWRSSAGLPGTGTSRTRLARLTRLTRSASTRGLGRCGTSAVVFHVFLAARVATLFTLVELATHLTHVRGKCVARGGTRRSFDVDVLAHPFNSLETDITSGTLVVRATVH